MLTVRPFKAIRPAKGKEAQTAALPYDVYNKKEARLKVAQRPLSFLRIDRAETTLPEDMDMYDDAVYARAGELLWSGVETGAFVQDEKPMYYIYEQTLHGRSQTGLVACASIDDYIEGRIKKHENTRREKEEDRVRHVEACKAQTGPIFLAYKNNPALRRLIEKAKQGEPLFSFVSDEGVGQRGWKIPDEDAIAQIEEAFARTEALYIADGHHRAASAVRVGLKMRAENPGYTGEEEFNYFLSIIFPGDELLIMDYNRVVRDLNGLTEEEFLARVGEVCEVSALDEARRPRRKGEVSMNLGGAWYRLVFKPGQVSGHPVDGLDVSILQREIIAPILGVTDPKRDERIDFIGGIRGLGEIERRTRTDMKVAFVMYPTSMDELFAVADAGLLMPPKSTWFEPKLYSGLFIHAF